MIEKYQTDVVNSEK